LEIGGFSIQQERRISMYDAIIIGAGQGGLPLTTNLANS
jgi:hypothetical protein